MTEGPDENLEQKKLLNVENNDNGLDSSEKQDDEDGSINQENLWNKAKGLVAMVLTVLSVTASGVSVQLLERAVPDFELNVFRTGTAMSVHTLVTICKRKWPGIRKSEIGVVFVNSLLGTTNALVLYIAISFLPLTSVLTIEQTLCMATGIPLFAKRLLFASLCVCGVILVTQPGFIFEQAEQGHCHKNAVIPTVNCSEDANSTLQMADDQIKQEYTASSTLVYIGYAMACITGLRCAANLLLLKKYTFLHENIHPVLSWQFITGTLVSIILMAILEHPVLMANWNEVTLVAVHSLSFTIMWPLYLYACQNLSANTISILWSTPVVFSLVMQYTVLSSIQPGHRNWMEVVGVVLVFLGTTLESVWKLLKSR